ncbi:MAG: DUF881 domain-containing protein [Bacillota bacterium]|nr:DUF881 domain-containing protein [Bacillota bacterium]
MRTKGGQISIMIVCLIVGIMISVQFKTTENYDPQVRETRFEDLTNQLNTIIEERDALAQEVLSLREKLTNINNNQQAVTDLQEELKKTNLVAGLLPVQGPGIVVTLNDSKRKVQPGENPNYSLVHEDDLLHIVNEMRASGAEAISINDERITAMSEIRCAGTTILVNWNKTVPPFEIRAIGDPVILESGMSIKGGYLETLKVLYGLEVQMQTADRVEIPAYKGPLRVRYSAPFESEEKAD